MSGNEVMPLENKKELIENFIKEMRRLNWADWYIGQALAIIYPMVFPADDS